MFPDVCYVYGTLATTTCTDMWNAASTTAALGVAYADIGTIFLYAIGAIIVAWAALVGLGFGKRKASRYVTGKKF